MEETGFWTHALGSFDLLCNNGQTRASPQEATFGLNPPVGGRFIFTLKAEVIFYGTFLEPGLFTVSLRSPAEF